MPTKILIDCDPGVDDALAIALAHGSPELEVVGLTTVAGNVPIEHTTRNALSLADYYGMSVPVARGADRPLLRELHAAIDVHGRTGLGGAVLPEPTSRPVDRHAVDFIIDTIAEAPGEIALVAVGPLTNIALALRKEPRITEWISRFVLMGGAYGRGNTTVVSEFNIAADPDAAAIVFDAPWTPLAVGLDLTRQAMASARVRTRFSGFGRLESELLSPSLDHYHRSQQYQDEEGPPVHDACAVAAVLDPTLLESVSARVDVETVGRFTTGMTVTDFGAPEETHNARVATVLHQPEFWDRMCAAFERVAAGIT